jgi:hypothetical protein
MRACIARGLACCHVRTRVRLQQKAWAGNECTGTALQICRPVQGGSHPRSIGSRVIAQLSLMELTSRHNLHHGIVSPRLAMGEHEPGTEPLLDADAIGAPRVQHQEPVVCRVLGRVYFPNSGGRIWSCCYSVPIGIL